MIYVGVNFNNECKKALTQPFIDVDSLNKLHAVWDKIELQYHSIENPSPGARDFYKLATNQMLRVNHVPSVQNPKDLQNTTKKNKFEFIISEVSDRPNNKEHLDHLLKHVLGIDLNSQKKDMKNMKELVSTFKKYLVNEQENLIKVLDRKGGKLSIEERQNALDKMKAIQSIVSDLLYEPAKTVSDVTSPVQNVPPLIPPQGKHLF